MKPSKSPGFFKPEYIEGMDQSVNPAITHRLHRGDFSIQAHVEWLEILFLFEKM